MQQDIKMRCCKQCKSHISTVWDSDVKNRVLSETTPWILEGEGTQRPPQRSEPPLGSAWACSLVCGGRARLSFPVC